MKLVGKIFCLLASIIYGNWKITHYLSARTRIRNTLRITQSRAWLQAWMAALSGNNFLKLFWIKSTLIIVLVVGCVTHPFPVVIYREFPASAWQSDGSSGPFDSTPRS